MQDRQIEQTPAQARIPILSDVLHFVAMTVVVFLRSSFGYVYLRPKSVFFAFSWASLLFIYFAWHERSVWNSYWLACIYLSAAVVLYWTHLARASFSQLDGSGKHDHFSGTSHMLRLFRLLRKPVSKTTTMNLHLLGEPAAVLLAALSTRFIAADRHLSTWLFVAAPCLFLKEAQNYWSRLRQRKRQKDIFEDTEATVEAPDSAAAQQEAPKPTRKAPEKRTRVREPEADLMETRFAETLRLLQPYTLEQAESHYRALIKQEHPDANESAPSSTARSAALNEAIDFFRKRLDRS